jgi:hypothetical protein
MINIEQVEKKIIQLREDLAAISRDIICRFPIENYLSEVKSRRQFRGYHPYFSRKRKRIFATIASTYGRSALTLYHKVALASLIADSLKRLTRENLPDEIVVLYHEWFECVWDDFSIQPDDYYTHDRTSFQVDVGICSLRVIPVGGAWTVHIYRIELGPLISGGASQFIDYLRFILFKMRGFSPFYVIHTVARHLRHFNKEEMHLSYLRIAKLMERNPSIKGLYRRSWLLDPKLEKISPNLVYLRQVPQQNGAKIFSGGSRKVDVQRSLSLSAVRRRLYAEGKYLPAAGVYIWPRKELLDWAKKEITPKRSN